MSRFHHATEPWTRTKDDYHSTENPSQRMVQENIDPERHKQGNLSSLTADATSQLNIFGHDGDTFGMNGAQVGVFKQSDKVGFRGFLERENRSGLEAKIILEVLGNFTNEALEGSFADQELGGLLVFPKMVSREVLAHFVLQLISIIKFPVHLPNFTKRDGSRAITVRLLHTTRGGSRLTSRLGSELLTRRFSSS